MNKNRFKKKYATHSIRCWDYSKHCCTKPEVSKGLLFWRLAGDWLAAYRRLFDSIAGWLAADWRLTGGWLGDGLRLACSWLADDWRLACGWLAASWRLSNGWLTAGRRLARGWLALAGRWLVGWLDAGGWLAAG